MSTPLWSLTQAVQRENPNIEAFVDDAKSIDDDVTNAVDESVLSNVMKGTVKKIVGISFRSTWKIWVILYITVLFSLELYIERSTYIWVNMVCHMKLPYTWNLLRGEA